MSSLQNAIKRCDALAERKKTVRGKNYNNNNQAKACNNNGLDHEDPKKLDYYNYNQLKRRIYSDELYILATEEWSITLNTCVACV